MTYPLEPLERAFTGAKSFLDKIDERSVAATLSIDDIRRNGIARTLPEDRKDASIVIDELIAATDGGHLGSASGRFFGWVIGGALPSALAADWLTSTWDNNATLAACGPASAVIEEVAGSWVKELLGLPSEASFAFTTGCQMAHVTCLAAARHALLKRYGHDVEKCGLFGAMPIRVLATEHRHGSIERALRFLGLGTSSLVSLPTDVDSRLTADVVERALNEVHAPTILVLDAGDLNVGAMDDFDRIIPLARKSKAWVHVDGAFGLWARASHRRAHLAQGIELADSWATDAHKWLNTPKDNGIAIIRDTEAHRAAMTIGADYLTAAKDVRDAIDWTPDWTRRARGIPVYAVISELGREGVAEMIDRCCEMATNLVDGLAALDGVELVFRPTLNQGLVRFPSPAPNATAEQHDAYNDAMIAAINAEGTAFFSGTVWEGRRAMRISVVNWRTDDEAVERTLAAVAKVLSDGSAASAPTHDFVI